MNSQELARILPEKLPTLVLESWVDRGDAVARVDRLRVSDFAQVLRIDAQLRFDMLLSLTAVDWMDRGKERFEVVYHFLSLAHNHRLRLKVWAPEKSPEVESLAAVYASAEFMEREVYDMYGLRFLHHPDLRRILMYDEFQGHPLRKDYPLRGKQPRVKLLHPEARNTARDMSRPPLARINPSKEGAGA